MSPTQISSPTTPDKIREYLHATVQSVLEKSIRGLDVYEQVLECRQLLECLPLSTGEFGLAVLRLQNAHRCLASDERGAAHFELRLLVGSLCNGHMKSEIATCGNRAHNNSDG
jgi:hypothetical protein